MSTGWSIRCSCSGRCACLPACSARARCGRSRFWPRSAISLESFRSIAGRDEGVDTAKNLETFARCHEELARGGILAIFPEGVSHDEPQLQPLKTGAARILIEAERRLGPLGSRILPVGLLFEERGRFRSRALVVVGPPIDPAEEVELAARDEATAVRLLTERVAEALERVTLNYRSWEESRLVERGARILETEAQELPRERRLATEFDARRSLLDGLDALRESHPREVAAAVEAARGYDRLLRVSGLRDAQVIASYPLDRLLAALARIAATAAVTLPVALLGAILNVVPFVAVELISRRFDDEENQVATYKVFPGILAYPTAWSLEALAAGWLWGGRFGLRHSAGGGTALRLHRGAVSRAPGIALAREPRLPPSAAAAPGSPKSCARGGPKPGAGSRRWSSSGSSLRPSRRQQAPVVGGVVDIQRGIGKLDHPDPFEVPLSCRIRLAPSSPLRSFSEGKKDR
jgi:hypothetical protein